MIDINKKRYKPIIVIMAVLIAIVLIIEFSGNIIYPLKYKEYVFRYSFQNDIDPFLVFAVIKAESNFKPGATSSKKARGLMQITDGTGKWAAESMDFEGYTPQDLYDPETNIRIGCWYLRSLMKEFEGDIDLVIAAYNGGSGKVSEWLRNREYSNSGTSLDRIPFRETHLYLKRVKNYYSIYKELYEKEI